MPFRRSSGLVNRQSGYGNNILSNGDFETDPNIEWTASDATLTSIAGGQIGNALQISDAGGINPGQCHQDFITQIGRIYEVTGYFKKGTGVSGSIQIGTVGTQNSIYDSGPLTDANWTKKSIRITAMQITTRLALINDNGIASETSLFDEFTFTDISARMTSILNLAKINIYTGPQVADADNAAAGGLLVTISNNSSATGLTFAAADGGIINKPSNEIWSGVIAASGVMGWFRIFEDGDDPASISSTAARIDGDIGITSAFNMIMSDTAFLSLVQATPFSIRNFTYTEPRE
jgi:hypothetical protein